jgi:hypothetical protein
MEVTDIISSAASLGSLFISIVTIRILSVTLKETVDLNRKQLELITFEINKAAREIRPEFSLTTSSMGKVSFITVACEKNIAFNVSTSINFDASMDDNGSLIYQNHNYESFYKPGATVWTGSYVSEEFPTNGFFRLQYMDEDGRKYEQRLCFNVNEEILNDRPTLVS